MNGTNKEQFQGLLKWMMIISLLYSLFFQSKNRCERKDDNDDDDRKKEEEVWKRKRVRWKERNVVFLIIRRSLSLSEKRGD